MLSISSSFRGLYGSGLRIGAGASSFADLKTVDGVLHDSFQAAAIALGLMEDDAELEKKLAELDGRLEASSNQDYDAHVAKVNLLRQSGELDKLRGARYARLALERLAV